jgi:YVTN family beta-propeller protein
MTQRTAVLLWLAVAGSTVAGQSSKPAAAGDGLLLVANKGARAVSIIDTKAGHELAQVPENDITAHELVASPDGKTAYVPIYGDSGVGRAGSDGRQLLVIDIASRKITGSIDFGKGVRPHFPLIGPKNGLLYVTTELDQTISIIDPKTLKIVGTVPTGQNESHMLAISSDGKRGYTANVGPGTVSVLDLVGKKTITVIPISKTTQRIAVSHDDKRVFTADQIEPRIAVIDAATNKIAEWIALPDIGFSTSPTPDGRWLAVTSPKSNKLFVINLKTKAVEHTLDMPKAPQEVLVRPDGRVAYVSCDAAKKVVAIRTSDWKVDTEIDAGAGADGLAWAGSH